MNATSFSTLVSHLKEAAYICRIYRDELPSSSGLLDCLAAGPAPYYNYVLCLDDGEESRPIYVGYTSDLPARLRTHARLVEFDAVHIYHAPDKQTALANEQTLMTLLGTKSLCNGSLTAQTAKVSRDQLTAALDSHAHPLDPLCRYTDSESYTRKTYYLTPVIAEALRTWCYEDRLDLSEAVRIALARGIPQTHLEHAYQDLSGQQSA